jgi:hypothetical protein
MESKYLIDRRARLLGQKAPDSKKEPKPIPKVSEKKKKLLAEEKKARGDEDPAKERWFKARRREMIGVCQCGCAQPSQKNDDLYFRHSAAHVFPKALFLSVALHPANCVERAFWGGCHTNMDEGGLDKWPLMADWFDIKERFHILAPLLTDEERATKFYTKFEALVYAN